MDPAGGDCVIPRDQQIKIFGQRFSNIFCQLNDTCRHFFEFISGQVFKNERDWRSALLCFKTSVLESAVGSRTERQEVYRQVESFLLDPTNQNVVVSKSRTKCVATRTSLIRLLTDVSTSRPSATCVVCKISGGIIVQCSGRRCTNTFHTFCAAATTYCKNPASRYYRCRSCVAPDAAFAVSTTKKKRSRIKASTKSRRKKNELDEEVLATVSVPGAHASDASDDDASDDEEQHQQEEQNEEDDGDGKDAEDGASLNASRPACSFYDSSFVTAATGVASEANVSRNAFFPAAFDTTPVFMTPSTNALASPNAASPLHVSCTLAAPVRGAPHVASVAPVFSAAAAPRWPTAIHADFTFGTNASATCNSVSDSPSKPLLDGQQAKVSISGHDTSVGSMYDASSTIESGGGWCIEDHFSVCIHSTLKSDSCGLVSLLEAANCLTASYDVILPDDASRLRKAVVDFITNNMDTCCEGGCIGLSRTWREEIALQYFPKNQNLTRPRTLMIRTNTKAEEFVYLESIHDYLEAMATPRTRIDSFFLLAFARMWDVRVVVICLEDKGWTSDNSNQFMPEKHLGEERSIFLVWTGQCFAWAHACGQDCGVASCRNSGKRVSGQLKFLNYRCDDGSALPSATALPALPSATPSKGKHHDFSQPFEELPTLATLHDGIHAGHEAVKTTENVAAEANVLSEACGQLEFAKSQLKIMYEDVQVSYQATNLKKHVACTKEKIDVIRTVFERARFEVDELIHMARGIQSVYKMSLVPASSSNDVTEDAIRILVALNSRLHLTDLNVDTWYSKLRDRGRLLSQMYRQTDFEVMVDETIGLLKQYSGRQILDDQDLAVFHEHLKTYGWVLSPQMWTREEIVVMCVILLDPKLLFNNILQKNIRLDEEKFQNRGMACLDPRVQAIMYSRLKEYKFVLEGIHLPIDIPAAVVLNSGGSFLQRGTWQYPVHSRFVVDDRVDPMLFEVTNAPAYTHCNALYIATKTRRPNGQPVYVSISPTQFFGPDKTNQPLWDSIPMKNYLSKDHVLHGYFSAEHCKGLSFPTERVLYWEDGAAVFQSVTAYGTKMKLLTVDCEKLGVHSTAKWSRIANFDFKNKNSIMVPGSAKTPTISCIDVIGTIAPNYTLACGPNRIEVRVETSLSKFKPKPLRKQSFHKDGPTLYDIEQFDDHGNILPDARCNTERTIPLPPGNSVSALFAFFCRTFLGIKPVESKKLSRSCTSGSLRLHASIGRAIVFYFDTNHQVWKHTRCVTCLYVFNKV